MGGKVSWNSRVVVTALSLVAFPILIMIVFYSSRTLTPSLAKLQFSLPPENISAISPTEPNSTYTISRPIFNGTEPSFLNLSFPALPQISYSEILAAIAVVVVTLVCLQTFRIFSNRRPIRPVSNFDLLAEERNRVAAIIDETVRRLGLGSTYRDTVLKCYKLIAGTLEAKSSLDGRALTASEFMRVVSERLRIKSSNLARATSLFEVARYSENEVTKEDATEAIECLSNLSLELKTMDVSTGSSGDNFA